MRPCIELKCPMEKWMKRPSNENRKCTRMHVAVQFFIGYSLANSHETAIRESKNGIFLHISPFLSRALCENANKDLYCLESNHFHRYKWRNKSHALFHKSLYELYTSTKWKILPHTQLRLFRCGNGLCTDVRSIYGKCVLVSFFFLLINNNLKAPTKKSSTIDRECFEPKNS